MDTSKHPYSLEEQIRGLRIVGELVAKTGCQYTISSENYPNDVCYLRLDNIDGSEIVYISNIYDVWKHFTLIKSDLSAKEAADFLINEYNKFFADGYQRSAYRGIKKMDSSKYKTNIT